MREHILKVLLILVGLFTAAVIPAWNGIYGADPNTGDAMQMAIYATLGVFLLRAVRKRLCRSAWPLNFRTPGLSAVAPNTR